MHKILIHNRYIFTFILLALCTIVEAQEQRVQGVITSMKSGKPISDVRILLGGVNICSSDADGKFTTNVSPSAQLATYHPDYESQTIYVDGRQILSISLVGRVLEIDEVVVSAKKSKSKIVAEPTDIEVKGDHFHLKSRFSVPTQLFKSDCRFILQPTIYNVTRGKRALLRPVVIDGRRYSIIEHRYLEFDNNNDKLHQYVVPNEITKDNSIYSYRDSLKLSPETINDEYKADCFLVIASYADKLIYEDSITIANGTKNPLHFLTLPLPPMALNGKTIHNIDELSTADSLFAPTPEFNLLSDKGEAKIGFAINSSNINLDYENNRVEIETIENLISSIERDPDSKLESIEMIGYASPDGAYRVNHSLAQRRTEAISNKVKSTLSNMGMAKYINFSAEGRVQSWSALIDLIAPDNQILADKIANIIAIHGDNFSSTSKAIMGLKEYRSIITKKYLPQLRRVEYSINYSRFREHSLSEIETIYAQDREQMTRYNTYKLIAGTENQKLREDIEEFAIRKFENFTWAINRVAIRQMLTNSASQELLQPFISNGKDTPQAILYNQAIIAMNNRDIDYAKELMNRIEESEVVDAARYFLSAIAGDYDAALRFFEKEGGVNHVLLLLAKEQNREAFELMKSLMLNEQNQHVAAYCYILAMCANRVDDLTIAIAFLDRALLLDETLKERAKIDSDVMDIYQIINNRGDNE